MYLIINFIALLLFYFAEYAASAVFPVYITEILGFDRAYAGYFVSVISMSSLIAKFFSGAIADRFNKIPLYTLALFSTGIAMYLCGMTGVLAALLVIRFIQGFSSGTIRTLYKSVTADIVPKNRLATAIGIVSATSIIGMMIASPFAIGFVKTHSYGMLFSILAMLYLGAAIMVAFIKTPVTTVPRFKLSLYTFLEKTVMPLALLRFFNSTCRGVFMAYNILYAIQMGVLNSGMVISTFAMANLLARPVSGYLTDRISRHKPFVIGIYLFLLAGFILFAFNVFAGAAVIGLGMGMESSAINGIAMKKSEHSALNRTSATMEVSFSLGMIAGASLSALYTGPLASLFIITAFVYLCPIAIILYKRT